MPKSTKIILILAIIVVIGGVGFAVIYNKDNSGQNTNANVNVNTNVNTNINTNQPIDTSTWKTYRNEELGFEFKYPEGWILERNNSKIIVYSKNYKNGLSLSIERINETLQEFIFNYNKSDATSEILEQKEILIDKFVSATKLTGSTSLGIDKNFIFINLVEKQYLISYFEFDEIHSEMISSLRLVNNN